MTDTCSAAFEEEVIVPLTKDTSAGSHERTLQVIIREYRTGSLPFSHCPVMTDPEVNEKERGVAGKTSWTRL